MSDILMLFVEYLKKSYDNNVSVKSRRNFYEDSPNNNFPDGCNQVYVEEILDRLIQQRRIFVLEPCSFRGEEYYLLTQKNLHEIYKDPQSIFMTMQGFWSEIKQYKDDYDLHSPKQRRLQDYKKDRARGILLTMDFIIDLMNNYVENTFDIIDAIEEQDCDNKDTLEDISNRESDSDYRIFKENVLSRDNHKCQCCGLDKRLHVHHIYSYTTHPELATDVTNGITLCQFCHQKYHSVYGKKDSANPVTFAQFIKRFGIR